MGRFPRHHNQMLTAESKTICSEILQRGHQLQGRSLVEAQCESRGFALAVSSPACQTLLSQRAAARYLWFEDLDGVLVRRMRRILNARLSMVVPVGAQVLIVHPLQKSTRSYSAVYCRDRMAAGRSSNRPLQRLNAEGSER